MIALCLILSVGSTKSQVTIGSGEAPRAGALLDLKDGTGTGDATATKGMMLPRVKLTDLDKLKMGNNEILDGTTSEHSKHTGLWVYNISGAPIPKCAPIPDGVYIWDGAKWKGIGVEKVDPATLTISSSNIDFPSGQDLRTMPTSPETFTVDWTPSDKQVTYTNTPHATFGGISFNGTNTPPANGNLSTNPTTFSLLPNAMSASEIASNPFRSKQNTLTFKVANECGSEITEVRVVNQTNKALTLQTPFKEATANSSETNTIKSNAQWKLKSIVPNDNTNAIYTAAGVSTLKLDGTPLATATTQGAEKNDNTSKDGTLSYDITVGTTKARYSVLTFEDAETPKRFSDVTLTVLQCTNVGQSPTIEQWALSAGFTQTQINNVKTTGTDSPILVNGIQLHKDQSGNLYLSSNFGANATDSDERWMIHNLAAKKFDTNVTYKGGATLTNKELKPYSGAGTGGTANTNAYKNPYFGYPDGGTGAATSTTYDSNERLGLLYTWDAATAGKGGSNGQGNPTNEGGQAPTGANKVQGICPNGWHLPNDYEWTVLENRFISNTKDFSETNNIGGTPLDPTNASSTGWRGSLHGKAMKEICEPTDAAKTHQGTSNGIGASARPGFDVFLAGYAYSGSAGNYGFNGYFWSASSSSGDYAWGRLFGSGNSQVGRYGNIRSVLFSVRCKKD